MSRHKPKIHIISQSKVNLIINSLSNKASSDGKGMGDDLKTALLIELPKG